jgi:hypothetical protein
VDVLGEYNAVGCYEALTHGGANMVAGGRVWQRGLARRFWRIDMADASPNPQGPNTNHDPPEAKKPKNMGCLMLASLLACGVVTGILLGVLGAGSLIPGKYPRLMDLLIACPLATTVVLLVIRRRGATIAGLILAITWIMMILTMGLCSIGVHG